MMDELHGDDKLVYQALIKVRPLHELVDFLRSDKPISALTREMLADALDPGVTSIANLKLTVTPSFQRQLDRENVWTIRLLAAADPRSRSVKGRRLKSQFVSEVAEELGVSPALVYRALLPQKSKRAP